MTTPNAEILRAFRRAAVLVERATLRGQKARRLRALRAARKHRSPR